MNKILFSIVFLFFLGFIRAQNDSPVDDHLIDSLYATVHYKNMLPADSVLKANPVSENTVYPKTFKKNVPSRYKGNEFDYSESKPRESFWAKLVRKIKNIFRGIFGETVFTKSAQFTTTLVRLFAIILVGFLLYFVIRYVLGKDGNFIFGKKNRKLNLNVEELHENIHEINFPESIAKFEHEKDYRSAVRYQFLFILKKLSDKKLIIWNPEKTNKDYVAEVKAPHLKKEFSDLSHIFEYVWYGEFDITEPNYQKFKNQFQTFTP
ncbi:DUF4129 domain-containing protein [Chryseobacterium indologenes]|uniref:DUF4129 domain-containing protein n=1 Tax=Chryseobacterium indologenes TaxID=253 RepID=UPI000F4DC81C|nr:DUF4129 domain-containing protein [Chryseobacterium indologenes]AYZ37344.1 DUF4129 domain-containing protein [Chryseobacterium indologenes]MBF6646208.1 DUF4129 domain-containing protein [Chryseobacterium indologenes]MBU3049481.1 DUF4129 domain-containing protein [Chryseobacterium indologenes]MEB4761846.1 DUF4129 domain-containing protein [Chryseobacterium indologenes]QQQ70117.1 DUF4129 domain-containing protein [Chryseobacterium indologenes]